MKKHIITGVGGIGKGIFFQSQDNKTLGRNESRMADQTSCRDFCKLQIVFYYISRFAASKYMILPIGYVGNDSAGLELRRMMKEEGMDVSEILIHDKLPTMLSFCLQYPDKSGCNITSANSACSVVTPGQVEKILDKNEIGEGDYVLALPEVPLSARIALLHSGKLRKAFCAASFAATEMQEVRDRGILKDCDLLALNQEESASLAQINTVNSLEDALTCSDILLEKYPYLKLWLTVGAKGSVSADLRWKRKYHTFPTEVLNTGGAGDATLGGMIAAMAEGLPFQTEEDDCRWEKGTVLKSAAEFGALLGEISVSSTDSIDMRIGTDYVRQFLSERQWNYQFKNLI